VRAAIEVNGFGAKVEVVREIKKCPESVAGGLARFQSRTISVRFLFLIYICICVIGSLSSLRLRDVQALYFLLVTVVRIGVEVSDTFRRSIRKRLEASL